MKKFLTERRIVVILFITALIVFSFAQEDARKVEAQLLQSNAAKSETPRHPAVASTPDFPAVTAARD